VRARKVDLRFFGGLSVKKTAGVLNVSPTTGVPYWMFARALLADELTRAVPAGTEGRVDGPD
jgi:ECF sigma factor